MLQSIGREAADAFTLRGLFEYKTPDFCTARHFLTTRYVFKEDMLRKNGPRSGTHFHTTRLLIQLQDSLLLPDTFLLQDVPQTRRYFRPCWPRSGIYFHTTILGLSEMYFNVLVMDMRTARIFRRLVEFSRYGDIALPSYRCIP